MAIYKPQLDKKIGYDFVERTLVRYRDRLYQLMRTKVRSTNDSVLIHKMGSGLNLLIKLF